MEPSPERASGTAGSVRPRTKILGGRRLPIPGEASGSAGISRGEDLTLSGASPREGKAAVPGSRFPVPRRAADGRRPALSGEGPHGPSPERALGRQIRLQTED